MAKSIGYILGGLMLLDGLNSSIQPRFGFRLWETRLRRYFPGPLDELTREFGNLSDPALRSIAVWEAAIGAVMIWLAGKTRE